MERTQKVSVEVTMTPQDLEVVALTVLRLGDPNKKIECIKKIRVVVQGVKPVDSSGEPLVRGISCECGEIGCGGVRHVTVESFGLKECKDALDAWFIDRQFIG